MTECAHERAYFVEPTAQGDLYVCPDCGEEWAE